MQVIEGTMTVENLDDVLADLAVIGEETGCAVQAFDARYVMGREHVERAVELADRAFDRGENVARERAVEILLYAAGRRQINRALAMGLDEGDQAVVVVVHAAGGGDEAAAAERVRGLVTAGETLGVEAADHDLVVAFFDVSAAELAAAAGDLQDVVLERVALLDVEK